MQNAKCKNLLGFLAVLLWGFLAPAASGQTKIIAGPMIGHVSDTSARLWMQLNTSEVVTVRVFDVVQNQGLGSVRVDVEGPAPFIFDSPLSGLKPNHNYRIEVLFDNKEVDLPEPQPVLRTAPPPGEATTFTVGFGSCMSPAALVAGEDAGARGGGSGGGRMPIFKPLDLIKPRAFFFLGNNGYLPVDFKEWPQKKRQAMRMLTDFHHRVRAAPDLQRLLRGSAIYGIWDEHDFGSADAGGGMGADGTVEGFVFTKESRAAFIRYWPNPDYGTPETPGVFYNVTLGDVDFFVLDNRTFRTPPMRLAQGASTMPGGKGAETPAADPVVPSVMLGAGQLAWLKAALTQSNATFKIVACGCPLLPTYRPERTWAAYPEERSAFFTWLRGSKISGVVMITGGGGGERFGSELSALTPPEKAVTEYPLYDLTCAPLAVPAALPAKDDTLENPMREGPAVSGINTFGTLDFGGPKSKRHLTMRVRDAEGKTRLEKVIFADELKGE